MTSSYTKKVIQAMIDTGFQVQAHDGEETFKVKTLKEAIDVLESTDDGTIMLINNNKVVGSCWFILCNDGPEQIVDYYDNELMNSIIDPIMGW